MRRPLAIALLGVCVWAGLAEAGGDRITTKDGRVYSGSILFHNDREYYLSESSAISVIAISDIEKIDFGPTSKHS